MSDETEAALDLAATETSSADTISEFGPRRAEADPSGAQLFERGDTLGRYVVLARLGAGGMGVVYAAYDPELDRKVAIKLVRNTDASRERGAVRLQREAQAMAKLSHPNVITVHDVGLVDGRVFIAMEFVDGQTLTQWLEGGPNRQPNRKPNRKPSWEAVVDVFVRAGAGLQAAHAAGLVHRDFKPDNVLIGNDGRIRVMDFGLARTDDDTIDIERTQPGHERDDLEISAVSSTQTAAGAIMGTPAYMAPEQHLGVRADPRADQFAFCVALFEGLYGRRPFRGDTLPTLVMAVVDGKLDPPPKNSPVPAWLRLIVLRGLERKPEDRFASMQALLAAIEEGRRAPSRRRIGVAAVLGLGLFGGLFGLLARDDDRAADSCAETRAQLESAWGEARREAVAAAFETAGLSQQASERAVGALDRYADAWTSMRYDNCASTRAGVQSGELMDLRTACLDRRRTELAALVDLLVAGERVALAEAQANIEGLMPLSVCADEAQLRMRSPLPNDADARAAIEAAEQIIADARARFEAGMYGDALARLDALPHDGAALAYDPIAGAAGLLRAEILIERGEYEAAEPVLQAAALAAARGRDDRLEVEIELALMELVGSELGKIEEGARIEHATRVALLRLGEPPELARALELRAARLRRIGGEPDVALAILERLQAELEAEGVADTQLGLTVTRNLAGLLGNRGEYERAEQLLNGLLAKLEQQLGPDHPALVPVLNNLATNTAHRGQLERAAELHARVLDLAERRLGLTHPSTAIAYESHGVARHQARDFVEARRALERAVDSYAANYDGAHPSLLRARGNLSAVLLELREFDAAERVLLESREILVARFGREHDYLIFLNNNLSGMYAERGRYDEAIAAAEWALEIAERKLGPISQRTAECLVHLGHAYARADQLEPAREQLERALVVLAQVEAPPAMILHAQATLAYVLAGLPDQRAAGQRMFEDAYALALASGVGGAAMLEPLTSMAKLRGIELGPRAAPKP